MANRIILKKSSVTAKVPLAQDLEFGELALNYADGKLFYKNSSGSIANISGGESNAVELPEGDLGEINSSSIKTYDLIIGSTALDYDLGKFTGDVSLTNRHAAQIPSIIMGDWGNLTDTITENFDFSFGRTTEDYNFGTIRNQLELASRHGAALPKQHNNSGKYLITDGYTSSWKNITWEEVNNKPSVATISYVNQNLALKANISSLSAIATTGNYDDLINKPTIPTNINSLSDVDTSTQAPNLNQVLAWNGSSWIPAYASSSSSVEWDNVLNKPTIAKAALQWTVNHTLADGTRYLAGDLVYDNGNIYKANYDNESIPTTSTLYWQNLGAGYRLNIDGRDIPNIRWNNIGNKPTFASVATSGSYNDLTNKPTLFSGSYNDLTNKPTLFSGSYNDLTNKPSLALVATSGSYNDLTNKPSLALVATSGSYNDLTNKPNALAAGTNSFGYIEHTGIYVVAGKWNSSGNTPSYTNSLYYEGYLNATRFYGAFYGDGSNITNISLYNKTHTGTIYHNGSVRSNLTPVTSTSFSCLTSNYFTKTISSDQTFTFIDVPASGVVYSFILELNYQSGTITWPISVQWSGSVAPTLVSSTINLFVFITRDGGSTWRGSVVKNYGA